MKTLPPQHLQEKSWSGIEEQIKKAFYDILFRRIMAIVRKVTPQARELEEIRNAGGNFTALLVALRSGRVQYVDGKFTGEFNIAIANDLRTIGARFSHREKIYKLEVAKVPEFIRAESANYNMKALRAHADLLRELNQIQIDLDRTEEIAHIDPTQALASIEQGWQRSARKLEVTPSLTKEGKENLVREYSKNINLYIKKFSQESTIALRELVEENAMQGFRFDNLIQSFRHRYGISANKAKFLARQETALFMSNYRKQRFTQSGVHRYRWSTARDERVRDSHKRLNGRVFSYEDPPITDRNTGAKNNPGGDYNCRCVDEPLLEYDPTGPDAGKIMSGVG